MKFESNTFGNPLNQKVLQNYPSSLVKSVPKCFDAFSKWILGVKNHLDIFQWRVCNICKNDFWQLQFWNYFLFAKIMAYFWRGSN